MSKYNLLRAAAALSAAIMRAIVALMDNLIRAEAAGRRLVLAAEAAAREAGVEEQVSRIHDAEARVGRAARALEDAEMMLDEVTSDAAAKIAVIKGAS